MVLLDRAKGIGPAEPGLAPRAVGRDLPFDDDIPFQRDRPSLDWRRRAVGATIGVQRIEMEERRERLGALARVPPALVEPHLDWAGQRLGGRLFVLNW